MATCASCGRELSDERAECQVCNAEDREIVLEPHRLKNAISMVKVGVIVVFFAIGLAVTFASRLPDFREAIGPAVLYVLGGVAVIVLLKFLVGRSDERL